METVINTISDIKKEVATYARVQGAKKSLFAQVHKTLSSDPKLSAEVVVRKYKKIFKEDKALASLRTAIEANKKKYDSGKPAVSKSTPKITNQTAAVANETRKESAQEATGVAVVEEKVETAAKPKDEVILGNALGGKNLLASAFALTKKKIEIKKSLVEGLNNFDISLVNSVPTNDAQPITVLVSVPEKVQFLSGNKLGEVLLWCGKTLSVLHSFGVLGEGSEVKNIVPMHDGDNFMVLFENGGIEQVSVNKKKSQKLRQADERRIINLAANEDGEHAYLATENSALVWDFVNDKVENELKVSEDKGSVTTIEYQIDSATLAIGTDSGNVLISKKGGELQALENAQTDAITSLAFVFLEEEWQLAAGSTSRPIILYSLQTNSKVKELTPIAGEETTGLVYLQDQRNLMQLNKSGAFNIIKLKLRKV